MHYYNTKNNVAVMKNKNLCNAIMLYNFTCLFNN